MTLLAHLFALFTMALFTAALVAIRRIDPDQRSASWFALFFALGTAAMVAHQFLQSVSGGAYPSGFAGAGANMLFVGAMAAFGHALPMMLGRPSTRVLSILLPLAMALGQLGATVLGDVSLRAWIMGTGALIGFMGSVWWVRGRARTTAERLVVGSVAIGSLVYVGAPGYFVATSSVDGLPILALRVQILASSFLGLVVGAALLTVHAERIHGRLVDASERDPLTGLLNRRGLERATEEKGAEDWGVIIGDLDRFKRVNDEYGHAAGDEVLRTMASVLRGITREDDVAARVGGEEFVVVLRESGLCDARAVAERLRDALGAIPQPALRGRRVTASFGVAVWSRGRHLNDAIASADRALYAAKRDGRDRTVAEGDPSTTRATTTRATERGSTGESRGGGAPVANGRASPEPVTV